ncbi:MAG: Coenzyme F420 hydrogenase/dehydrogenase, beta subunit C-terminal domain [Promethearchaeota archaeon]
MSQQQASMVDSVNFENVVKEVIDKGKCTNCGACDSICFLLSNNVISIDAGRIRRHDRDNCDKCGLCYAICPRTKFNAKGMGNNIQSSGMIGDYLVVKTFKTNVDALADGYQDGGLVTSLLLYLVDSKLIDAALVTVKKDDDDWRPRSILTNDREEIMKSAGTIYATSPVFDAFKALGRSTQAGSSTSQFNATKKDFLRVAMVGLPCQFAALQKMQDIEIFPSNIVKYRIGLFCFENFDYETLFKKKIEAEMGIPANNIKSMNIKGKMIIHLKSGETVELTPREFQSLAREGCHWCDDLTNLYSDLSCGGIGAPAGYTSVIIRNRKALQLINKARAAGYIEEGPMPNIKLIKKIAKKKIKKQKKEAYA